MDFIDKFVPSKDTRNYLLKMETLIMRMDLMAFWNVF